MRRWAAARYTPRHHGRWRVPARQEAWDGPGEGATPISDPLHLTLFGSAGASAGGVPLPCPSKKAFGLFAFLALERRPHSRHALSGLFWGQRDPEAARTSLRATLYRLPLPLQRCLVIGRESLALADDAPLTCDVHDLQALLSVQGTGSLEAAATLYRGHLLEAFEPDATPEFDDWLERERTRLKRMAYRVFDQLIGAHYGRRQHLVQAATQAHEAAVALAQRWLQIDPAAERAHRWLIQLHLAAGRSDDAKTQYELCRRSLAVAEGRPPSEETQALLADGIPTTTLAPGPSIVAAPDRDTVSATPVPLTTLVGRTTEVTEILGLFADPACRLVTLHGVGGVGKTRLAHAVAQQAVPRVVDGVTWVSLERVVRPAGVAEALAQALGIELGPRSNVRDDLVARLKSQRRLIVLDNVEHLLETAHAEPNGAVPGTDPVDLVLDLMREAPELRLLVTSRHTLEVQEEWVFGVEGLAFPKVEGPAATQTSQPAVELFAQRARQAHRGFSLTTELPFVARLCQQVEGLPLGIELIAAWVRTLPCADILQSLEGGGEVPAAAQRNRPARHHSLDSAIEFSWRMLTPDQQQMLAVLSVFRGGFTSDAAQSIAGALLRDLSALVDKALVRRSGERRYSLHPVVRWFAAEKLAEPERLGEQSRARYSAYYLRLLCERHVALSGAGHALAKQELEGDLDNVRAAWEVSVRAGAATAVRDTARPLCVIFDRLGLYDAWVRTFDDALRAFCGADSTEVRSARTQLLIAAASGHWRRGDVARATAHRDALLEAIESSGVPGELADLHKVCGLLARDAGDLDDAVRHFVAGVDAARQDADPVVRAHLANELGVTHWRRGKLDEARRAFVESLAISEAGGCEFDVPTALHNVAFCDMELGHFDAVEGPLSRALELFRQRSSLRGEAMVLSSLGILARRRGDRLRARELSRQCLGIAERMGSPGAICDALDDLGQATEQLGEFPAALTLYQRALAMAHELGQSHLQCFVQLHLARALRGAALPADSARNVREALARADEHAFVTGRLMGILVAAGLRSDQAGPEAQLTARAWCRAVLHAAGGNVDVQDALPACFRDLLDPASVSQVRPPSVDVVQREVVAFLDDLCGRREDAPEALPGKARAAAARRR